MMQFQTTLAPSAPWPWSGPYQPVVPKQYAPVPARSFLTSNRYADFIVIERDLKIEKALDGKTTSILALVELTGMNLKTMRQKVCKWQGEGKVVCVNEAEYAKNPLTRRLYTLANGWGNQ